MASSTADRFYLYASPAGYYSLEITDASTSAVNIADDLKLGLKYGGTETLGLYAGADANASAVYLYDGDTKIATSYIGADTAGKVIFSLPSGSEIEIPKGSKVLTLKADLSDYTGLTEGSTLKFSIGTSTVNASDTDYITAKGASSGDTVGSDSIVMDAEKAANAMYLYATKPTVSLNASSPSGVQAPSSNQEVFRFDVTAPNTGFDLNINAIRFSISSNATSVVWDKSYNLYKSTDLTTSLGSSVSYANATGSDTTGWVTIYPHSGYTVGNNSTATYVLKADTSSMDTNPSTYQLLTVSIEDGDFYWDDGLAVNANKKVLNLPVTGNTLKY
jgi:hypothetical protein